MNIKNNKIQLTQEGLKAKQDKLRELIEVERPKLLVELSEARSQGDLSENADYDAAKEKQAQIESEIANLEELISRAEVIKKSNSKKISIGQTVTYQRIDTKETKKVKLVGFLEADPMLPIPLVGIDSPIGKALIGNEVGETVNVVIAKSYDIVIKKAE